MCNGLVEGWSEGEREGGREGGREEGVESRDGAQSKNTSLAQPNLLLTPLKEKCFLTRLCFGRPKITWFRQTSALHGGPSVFVQPREPRCPCSLHHHVEHHRKCIAQTKMCRWPTETRQPLPNGVGDQHKNSAQHVLLPPYKCEQRHFRERTPSAQHSRPDARNTVVAKRVDWAATPATLQGEAC